MPLWKSVTNRRRTIVEPPLIFEVPPFQSVHSPSPLNQITNPSSFSSYKDDFDLFYKEDSYTDSEDGFSAEESPLTTPYMSPIMNQGATSIVPDGPYCPRRPKLAEILADKSPPPWTLSAFFAYCSQNHCLENLEFMKDAKGYETLHAEAYPEPSSIPDEETQNNLKTRWNRLVNTYIKPNSPRELNLTGAVREPIVSIAVVDGPPSPSLLEPATRKIFELIQESILFGFLNETQPFSNADDNFDVSSPRSNEHSRPNSGVIDQNITTSNTSRSTSEAPRRHTSTVSQVSHRHRQGTTSSYLTSTTSHSSTASGDVALTDDADSVSSPGTSDVMTPPTTPPTSDLASTRERSASTRTKSNSGDSWKNLGSRFGFGKRSGSSTKGSRDGISRTLREE